MKRFAIALVATLATGCTTGYVYEDPEPTFNNPDYSQPQLYALDGTLTTAEADWLIGLNWPQTYDAMKNTFGLPAYRSETADIYQVTDGRTIQVFYDGDQATGYEVK